MGVEEPGPLECLRQGWARDLPASDGSRLGLAPLAHPAGGAAVANFLSAALHRPHDEEVGSPPVSPLGAGGRGPAVSGADRCMPQDRKIAHCPFHTLTPAEREVFLARKRLLEYMGFQLRRAVFAKESQWDPKLLTLSKRGGCQWLGGAAGAIRHRWGRLLLRPLACSGIPASWGSPRCLGLGFLRPWGEEPDGTGWEGAFLRCPGSPLCPALHGGHAETSREMGR